MTGWEQLLESGAVRTSVDLAPHTTYKLGGPAAFFSEPADEAELLSLANAWRHTPYPLLVLGRGSNLIVADHGYPGLVVHLGQGFRNVVFEGNVVIAGGAVHLPALARTSVEQGRRGLEFLIGIPGSVGGAVRMNAGCHGAETVDVLLSARIVDMGMAAAAERVAADLDLGYRHSNLACNEVVVEARWAAPSGEQTEGEAELREITRWRRDHQPGGTLNAGSVFKNPPEEPAGRLIDRLGLKGSNVGDVRVSEKHANFFVAGPNATAEQVRRLVEQVQGAVKAATGLELETEIRFVGWEEP